MNWIGIRLAELQLAFMLLTRLPAGTLTSQLPELAHARWAFPIVGCIVGGIIAASYIILSLLLLPSFAAAILAITAGLFSTGAIHEDGLADCADGFGGGQNREKKLAIMRDSAIGSYGTLSLIIIMGLRISLLSMLPAKLEIVTPIIICAVISRYAMVGYLCLLPAARQDGLGNQASGNQTSGDNISALLLAGLIALPAFVIGAFGLIYVIIAIVSVALIWGVIAKYQLGGQTGDVCGAGQIICETAGWLIIATIYGGL
ncbi:adenosylcobinamide-GDP ribazoletransferase [Alphaproteobacteria bacterium]|jgi:adenosylcobinamide-GDP ribazoletransferase|nr:adenosylcobinamide-GDP ribazoletransferase [Alphaproteobacteria bacterium]MDC0970741.1 adenosylcobinamide-GDP ribazoletransferase [Alphaproteobacteria bacterium]CAI8436040.1 MAG: Adenosylcobinamide-GDP ribazoletransferase [SAR116 cluster bacterium]